VARRAQNLALDFMIENLEMPYEPAYHDCPSFTVPQASLTLGHE
jgi:hypothetical protein